MIFVKDFFRSMQARVVIFDMQVGDDVLYFGIENQPSSVYSICICAISFFPYFEQCHFSSKISQQPFRIEFSYLVYRFTMAYFSWNSKSTLSSLFFLYLFIVFLYIF